MELKNIVTPKNVGQIEEPLIVRLGVVGFQGAGHAQAEIKINNDFIHKRCSPGAIVSNGECMSQQICGNGLIFDGVDRKCIKKESCGP